MTPKAPLILGRSAMRVLEISLFDLGILVTVGTLVVLPGDLVGQASDEPSIVRMDVRIGVAEHDKGGAAYLGEIVLRTRGPAVVGIAGGWVESRAHDVQLVQYMTKFEGAWVVISRGGAHFHSFRPRGLVGYAFELGAARIEPTFEAGFARETQHDWQPWFVAGLGLRSSSGIGVQGAIGRHRVEVRYHLESGPLVHEFYEWGTFSELWFSYPLN
jgi:hypothetical protein